MFKHLQSEKNVSEGGLIELANIQKELMNKRQTEEYDDDNNKRFTTTFLKCNDILLGHKPAWENINATLAYNVTSTIITTCSKSGEIYVNKNETKDDMVYNGTMIYTEIRTNINSSSDYCFPYCSK